MPLFIFRIPVIVCQNLEVNRVSLSETMVLGNPCSCQTSLRNIRAMSGAFFASLQGYKVSHLCEPINNYPDTIMSIGQW